MVCMCLGGTIQVPVYVDKLMHDGVNHSLKCVLGVEKEALCGLTGT